MASIDINTTIEVDLLRLLERHEPAKSPALLKQSTDSYLRSYSLVPSDMRASLPPTAFPPPTGQTMTTRGSATPNLGKGKKKGDQGFSRTFSSLTSFLKSGSTPSTPTPALNSTTTPKDSPAQTSHHITVSKGVAISTPNRASPEDVPPHRSASEEDDTPVMREEDFPDAESLLVAGTSSTVASSSVTASSASPTSSHMPAESLPQTQTHLGDEIGAEDEQWDDSAVTPPNVSGSVSRALLVRENSLGPAFVSNTRRSKRTPTHFASSSDYIAARPSPSLNSSSSSLLTSTSSLTNSGSVVPGGSLLAAVTSPSAAAFSKSTLLKTASLIIQATLETEIDFPLCVECALDTYNDLEDEEEDLDSLLAAYERELQFQEHVYFQEEDFAHEIAAMEEELATYERDGEAMKAEILAMNEEMHVLRARDSALLMEKSDYWRQFEMHAADREAMLENTISAYNRLTHAKKWLDIVRSSHVVNDAFYISVELHLATISGLRLGRLLSAPVDWPEISAALGLTLQLLHELALRGSFAFTKYKLILDGSFSGLQRIQSGTIMPLHADGDISLVRLVQFKSVNDALAALLECTAELAAHLKALHPSFNLPFTIVKDQIAGTSIKRAWNSTGATWSTALRSLLANLKYILAFEAKQGLCV